MRNPWTELPGTPPYVASVDRPVLARHPKHTAALRLDFLPAPFLGGKDSDVVLLTLNPGATTNDRNYGDVFVDERRRAMRFESRFPFWCLNPAFAATEGYRYWTTRLR